MLDVGELRWWGADVDVVAELSKGVRNDVDLVCVDGVPAVARRSRRSEESLDWELDLLELLSAQGFVVPRPVRTIDDARRVGRLSVLTWVDGEPPATSDDWATVRDELGRLHDVTAGWPRRPGFASARDLLGHDAGGDIDLARMPADVVSVCRAAWACLPVEDRSHVVHGDPGPSNLRLLDGRVALLDWDEARVDHAWFDLADLPIQALHGRDALLARRAADAWETANSWTLEPDYALARLRRLRATSS